MNFIDYLSDRIKHKDLPGIDAHDKMMHPLTRPSYDMAPEDARVSAVMIYLFERNDVLFTYLIERKKDNSVHSGQISCPGGRRDDSDVDLIHTALRETHEEINMVIDRDAVIGMLTPLYIPVSNFLVYPHLAYGHEGQHLIPSPEEVERIIAVPLDTLFQNKKAVKINGIASHWQVSAYYIEDDTFVWGATAMILAELELLWGQYKLII